MTKYERIVRTARRLAVIALGVECFWVYVGGENRAMCGPYETKERAAGMRDDIRAALIADMCRVANVKPPKARRR